MHPQAASADSAPRPSAFLSQGVGTGNQVDHQAHALTPPVPRTHGCCLLEAWEPWDPPMKNHIH